MERKKIIKFIFVIFIIILLVSTFLPLKIKKDELIKQNQGQKETIRELAEENVALEEELNLLRENLDYIEEVARKELGLVKKGEIIYRSSSEEEESD